MVENSKLPRRRGRRLSFGCDVSTCRRMSEMVHNILVDYTHTHTHLVS